MRSKIQIIWREGKISAWSIGFWRWEGSMSAIYRWSLVIGPVEVRRWTKPRCRKFL